MHITVATVQAWLEETKLSLSDLEPELESQIASVVISRLSSTFDVSAWDDEDTTPQLVQTLIAMLYAAWLYDKAYSDNAEEPNAYATLLRQTVEANLAGLLSGNLVLVEDPLPAGAGSPVFYPNDASSAMLPSTEFPSDGPPAFTMGTPF